jgi:hypothetical protein
VSRSERILEVIAREMERRRASLDADEALASVSLIVKFDNAGAPCTILFRTEGQRSLRAASGRAADRVPRLAAT